VRARRYDHSARWLGRRVPAEGLKGRGDGQEVDRRGVKFDWSARRRCVVHGTWGSCVKPPLRYRERRGPGTDEHYA